MHFLMLSSSHDIPWLTCSKENLNWITKVKTGSALRPHVPNNNTMLVLICSPVVDMISEIHCVTQAAGAAGSSKLKKI